MAQWVERDHPRDPAGRFRDKSGWATKVSDRVGLPSLKGLLENSPPNAEIPGIGESFEGRYGRGGMLVRDVGVSKTGGDSPDRIFAPLGHLDIGGDIVSDDDPEGLRSRGYFRITATQDREARETDPLKWIGHIDRMHVRGAAQGGGGGRELTERFIDWFRRSGFDEVTVGPSEIGSYAWGAMGFDFQDRESRKIAWEGAASLSVTRVREWFQHSAHHYGLGDGSDLSDSQIKRMISQYRRAAALALAGGMSYQRLSAYGRRRGQGKNDWWAGKLGLLVGGVGSARIKLR